MYPLALILSGTFFPLPPTEAELLLRQMDSKIIAAKTLRIEFEVRGRVGKKDQPVLKGSVALADRNRFRFEARSEDKSMGPVELVSDGKRIGSVANGKSEILPLPDWYAELLRSWLGRGGTFLSMYEIDSLRAKTSSGQKPGPDDGPRVSNVQLLPDETAGGVRCRVVGYDLTWEKGEPAVDARVRVWIDPKMKLPVCREMAFRKGIGEGPWTATHTKFEIDPKLDDKLFEVPK